MSEQEPSRLERKIQSIFESPSAESRAAQFIDSSTLTPTEIRSLAETLVASLDVNKPCHVCGELFDSQSALQTIVLGPIGAEGKQALAHKGCFEQRIAEHPELKSSEGKAWVEFSPEEREHWERVFSAVDPNTFLGQLFGTKK